MNGMSTEQAMKYLNPANDEAKVDDTPSVESTTVVESESEDKSVAASEDNAATSNDNDDSPKQADELPSDEGKSDVSNKADNNKSRSQRDYAFIRLKNKMKAQAAKDAARIAELEEQLKTRNSLEEQHFKKADGTPDSNAYIRNEFAKRDMQDEINAIRRQADYERAQFEMEQDRIITERCFEGKDLQDYRDLIASKGKAFAEALNEYDPNHVVLNYLDTLQEYPIVVKELMSNMNTLGRLFRSRDPESLKYNVRKISDEIIENFHHSVQQHPLNNKAIPVIGKQINSTHNVNASGASLLTSNASINKYLASHKHR